MVASHRCWDLWRPIGGGISLLFQCGQGRGRLPQALRFAPSRGDPQTTRPTAAAAVLAPTRITQKCPGRSRSIFRGQGRGRTDDLPLFSQRLIENSLRWQGFLGRVDRAFQRNWRCWFSWLVAWRWHQGSFAGLPARVACATSVRARRSGREHAGRTRIAGSRR